MRPKREGINPLIIQCVVVSMQCMPCIVVSSRSSYFQGEKFHYGVYKIYGYESTKIVILERLNKLNDIIAARA